MKSKNLLVLGAATVAIIFISIFATYTEQSNVTDEAIGKRLFKNLESQINDITQVEILNETDKTSISKMGDTWVVNEKYKQPADMQQLKQLFLTLATSTIIERKTKKPEQHAKLGVENVSNKGANSKAITLKNSNGDILASAILGKSRPPRAEDSKDALYIRKIGDPQSWLVTGKLKVSVVAAKWLASDLINIGQERIKSVSIDHPNQDDQLVKIEKIDPSAKDYTLLDIPKEKEIRNTATVNNLALGLKEVKLEDMLPKNEIEFVEKSTTNAKYETFDGLIVNVKVMKKDEIWYTQFSASSANNSSEEVSEEVKAEIAKLNEKFKEWAYILPSYKAVNFRRKIGDLAKDKRT
ncbi:MAG: DUF4340 domain-containing protein [Gammaproteobacteria bacterium]|nr:DUF4340 domain-containing protein [Gammaproteobacteria bacterium]